jgi:AcrR family transcriptional regulator
VSRADDRRAELTGRIADFILAEGLDAASLRPLARAAGLSDRMLLYYFTDKADALASALDCLAARLMALLASASAEPLPEVALWDRLSSQARDPALWPYLCLWLEIAARAARGEPFWHDRGRALGQGFHDWIAAQLDAPPDRRNAASLALFQRLEGLVVLCAVGLDQAPRDQR